MIVKDLSISRRVGLLDLFRRLGFKEGVEVGTDHGGYAKNICDRMPHVTLFTIDPWLGYTEGDDVKTDEDVEQIYQEAKARLADYPNCIILRKKSMDAVKDFQDNSLDFVFIDGNHEYEYVYEDLVEWTKKVKPGGIIAGHDFVKSDDKKYGVIEAVDRYCKEMDISHLYLLKKGSYVPCYMFIKSWI